MCKRLRYDISLSLISEGQRLSCYCPFLGEEMMNRHEQVTKLMSGANNPCILRFSQHEPQRIINSVFSTIKYNTGPKYLRSPIL
jgi:hypothetical protein